MNETARRESTLVEGMTCPLCGSGKLAARQCKLVCEECGYVESCEDNFPVIDEDPPPNDA